jgi:hypothetical protein
MAHSLRSVGSAALNFCLVATGALDAYWEIGCWPWDVCAASVIATEAGCLVSGDLNSSNHRDDGHDGVVREEVLVGRKYVVVRAVAVLRDGGGLDTQLRIHTRHIRVSKTRTALLYIYMLYSITISRSDKAESDQANGRVAKHSSHIRIRDA